MMVYTPFLPMSTYEQKLASHLGSYLKRQGSVDSVSDDVLQSLGVSEDGVRQKLLSKLDGISEITYLKRRKEGVGMEKKDSGSSSSTGSSSSSSSSSGDDGDVEDEDNVSVVEGGSPSLMEPLTSRPGVVDGLREGEEEDMLPTPSFASFHDHSHRRCQSDYMSPHSAIRTPTSTTTTTTTSTSATTTTPEDHHGGSGHHSALTHYPTIVDDEVKGEKDHHHHREARKTIESLSQLSQMLRSGDEESTNAKMAAAPKEGVRAHKRIRPGHWRLGEMIGNGSFGKVFRGLVMDSGQLIAVKALPTSSPAADADDLHRVSSGPPPAHHHPMGHRP